jgi:uncharacterized membrane protein
LFAYGALRWATLKSSAFDLAYFDQVVWNASRGHGFVSSFAPYPFFGQHFSPALALFVPLYLIHPSPLWLLGAQSLALGAALVPLYLLAHSWLDEMSAAIACIAFAFQLFVLRAVNNDFHTEVLAVPFVFWAVLGAVRASRSGDMTLLLAGIVPTLCKEDGALASLGIGFLAWAVFRRRAGVGLMALALVYGLVVTAFVMPAIRGGQAQDLIGRYDYLGSSVPAILASLITHPSLALTHLFSPGPLLAVALLLGGVAFLPILRPVALLAALPALVFALLSQKWAQETLLDQYGIQAGSLVFVAALLGWARLQAWTRRAKLAWPVFACATVVALALATPSIALGSLQTACNAQMLASEVPPDASVAGSSDLLPLLAERNSIAVAGPAQSEWAAVNLSTDAGTLAALPGEGYVRVGSWGNLSLWHRQRYVVA